MIKRFCDLCKKNVAEFHGGKPSSGSLNDLWTSCQVEEVCAKCFEKCDKAVIKVTKESDAFFRKRLKELLKIKNETT